MSQAKGNDGDDDGPSSVHLRQDQKDALEEELPEGMSRGDFIVKAVRAYSEESETAHDIDDIADAVAERVDGGGVDMDRFEDMVRNVVQKELSEVTGGA